ncbi:catechol 2,3-dioxygenase-like lactoylglutathione lyase family enzyme [Spinactinospora alkalitolerans]|uniref:Catechol 2,3-dioxygenase-like lactoylglutathione lyase family enzyme n=1 Tax=Spinactinospora alkalitolerans TaxID=687207 RepID=A0A852TQ13_9ACTN|nr:VOC family protein [Spinactinospora alkalitolerans]NYE45367.1 catechol 2,3-dioxygenase-like lactoylglutathione lyase family enzyme [Spinactinospora alkalitolerans]
MDRSPAPVLAGVHHLKLPVADLARSREWYADRLGYEAAIEFIEDGRLMGCMLRHPRGGPDFALRLDPARAEAAAGFDYFAIGVPDKAAIDELAERLTALGEAHAGVHLATVGWILPMLHDPDGHEIRFYTIEHHTPVNTREHHTPVNAREHHTPVNAREHHTPVGTEGTMTVRDPRETAQQREQAHGAPSAPAAAGRPDHDGAAGRPPEQDRAPAAE